MTKIVETVDIEWILCDLCGKKIRKENAEVCEHCGKDLCGSRTCSRTANLQHVSSGYIEERPYTLCPTCLDKTKHFIMNKPYKEVTE